MARSPLGTAVGHKGRMAKAADFRTASRNFQNSRTTARRTSSESLGKGARLGHLNSADTGRVATSKRDARSSVTTGHACPQGRSNLIV
jgi:hypothetical protein